MNKFNIGERVLVNVANPDKDFKMEIEGTITEICEVNGSCVYFLKNQTSFIADNYILEDNITSLNE